MNRGIVLCKDELLAEQLQTQLNDHLAQLSKLHETIEDLRRSRNSLYQVVYSPPYDDDYTKLVDKFIRDNNFSGIWERDWRCERYFYLDSNREWNCYEGDECIYYRDVELRYQMIKTP